MLQGLLVERFKMKFHRENEDVPGFALVLAKNGPKLRPAKGEDVVERFSPNGKPFPGQPVTFTAHKYSMQKLADELANIQQAPVIDTTGLQGDFDFELTWDDTNGPSLTTALQTDLGLRLEAQKAPVSMFVMESAQRPGAN